MSYNFIEDISFVFWLSTLKLQLKSKSTICLKIWAIFLHCFCSFQTRSTKIIKNYWSKNLFILYYSINIFVLRKPHYKMAKSKTQLWNMSALRTTNLENTYLHKSWNLILWHNLQLAHCIHRTLTFQPVYKKSLYMYFLTTKKNLYTIWSLHHQALSTMSRSARWNFNMLVAWRTLTGHNIPSSKHKFDHFLDQQ